MFERFRALFSSDSLLDEAYDTTVKMLEFDHQMYRDSHRILRASDTNELPYDFKEADRRINKFEREVRRKVLTHLTVTSQRNLVPGLVLTTIVIDVERLGDFTKNIAGLVGSQAARLRGGPHEEGLKRIEEAIEKEFPEAIEILKNQDEEKAAAIVDQEPFVAETANGVIDALVAGEHDTLSGAEAVRLALYTRYLKRINAHLTNIASSIVNPFPRIGFRSKKPRH